MTPETPPPPVRLTVGDAAVARIAARCAARVPGVVSLRADPGRALLGRTGGRRPPDGVDAAVHGATAAVSVTIVTRLGHNCLDVVQAVQREVAVEVAALTGLDARVRVTVADVLLD